jgi:beta-glucosidase-like glycosyl hydrolase
MTLQATLDLLRAILADLPAAITTGRDLIMVVNQAYERLAQAANEDEITHEDIERAVAGVLANSRKIQAID